MLSEAIPNQAQSRYDIGETTLELDIETINQVIEELTAIGEVWLNDTNSGCFKERKQIMSYLLQQWIRVGEETQRFYQTKENANS